MVFMFYGYDVSECRFYKFSYWNKKYLNIIIKEFY